MYEVMMHSDMHVVEVKCRNRQQATRSTHLILFPRASRSVSSRPVLRAGTDSTPPNEACGAYEKNSACWEMAPWRSRTGVGDEGNAAGSTTSSPWKYGGIRDKRSRDSTASEQEGDSNQIREQESKIAREQTASN